MNNRSSSGEDLPSDIKFLDQLYCVCDRVSHLSRTQLGVVKGVIDDLVHGVVLDQQDYQDAKDALIKLVKIIDSLKEFARKPSYNPIQMTIQDFVASLSEGLSESAGQILVKVSGEIGKNIIQVDLNLFNRGLTAVLRYLKNFSKQDFHPIDITIGESNILFSFKPIQAFLPAGVRAGLTEFLKVDPSCGSLVFVFLENVLSLHCWKCEMEVINQKDQDTNELLLRILF